MHSVFCQLVFCISVLGLGLFTQAAQADTDMPVAFASALLLKVAAYETHIADSEKDISIYVFHNPKLHQRLAKQIGRSIGKTKLGAVEGGSEIPVSPPDIVVIGNAPKLQVDNAINYAKSIKALSFSSSVEVARKGVAVGLSVGTDNRARILLNLKSSSASELKWNPAIMKKAQIVNY